MKASVKTALACVLLLIYATTSSAFQQPHESLEIGKPIKGELKLGSKAVYSIEVAAGKTVAIQVYQKGVDVIVRAFAPSGKKLAGVDAPIGEHGAESLWFITSSSGVYRIEIEAYDGVSFGPFELLLAFVRSTIPQDKQVIAAQTQLQNSYNNLADAIERINQTGSSTSVSSSRNTRESSVSNVPSGATAECMDGTFSYSRNRRGTCSHHGGVKRWLR